MRPMLASAGTVIPGGPEWAHEIKWDGKEQARVLGALEGRSVDTSPFADEVSPRDAQGSTWVRPEVVVEVQYLGLSAQGRLRQPAYLGLRPDLSPVDLHDQG